MKKSVLGIISLLFALVMLACIILRIPGYTTKGVHPALLALKQPLSSATAHFYFDGGSVGVELIDADGKPFAFALPAKSKVGGVFYPELVIGVTHSSLPGGVTHSCSEDSRRFIAALIDKYADQGPDRLFCLEQLRDAPIDKMRIWWYSKRL